jgi:hypothetical protein
LVGAGDTYASAVSPTHLLIKLALLAAVLPLAAFAALLLLSVKPHLTSNWNTAVHPAQVH